MNETDKAVRKFKIGSRIEDAQVGGGGGIVTKCGKQQVWFISSQSDMETHGHVSNFKLSETPKTMGELKASAITQFLTQFGK
jgi:hypothetical protein